MAFSGDHMEAAQAGDPALQSYVGAPTGHVRGHRDAAPLTRMGDDPRLFPVADGVQDPEGQAQFCQTLGQIFAGFDATGAHKHRLALPMPLSHFVDNRLPLRFLLGENAPGIDLPLAGTVRGNGNDRQAIDMPQLAGGLPGGSGHACQPVKEPEKPLKAQARQRFAGSGDGDALLCLNDLVQTGAPGALRHQPPGKLIHDHYFAMLNYVLGVAVEKLPGFQRLLDQLPVLVPPPEQSRHVARFFHQLILPPWQQVDVLELLIDAIVHAGLQGGGDLVGLAAGFNKRFVGHFPGDDQGGDRLVNQDAVHFVHHGGVNAAHDQSLL